jgi:hypothetical protein
VNARISDKRAVIYVVERVDIDRGQIFLDRGIEPVEHIVHARGFRDALAIATIERIERSAQHRLEHIDHAQRLACGAGEKFDSDRKPALPQVTKLGLG